MSQSVLHICVCPDGCSLDDVDGDSFKSDSATFKKQIPDRACNLMEQSKHSVLESCAWGASVSLEDGHRTFDSAERDVSAEHYLQFEQDGTTEHNIPAEQEREQKNCSSFGAHSDFPLFTHEAFSRSLLELGHLIRGDCPHHTSGSLLNQGSSYTANNDDWSSSDGDDEEGSKRLLCAPRLPRYKWLMPGASSTETGPGQIDFRDMPTTTEIDNTKGEAIPISQGMPTIDTDSRSTFVHDATLSANPNVQSKLSHGAVAVCPPPALSIIQAMVTMVSMPSWLAILLAYALGSLLSQRLLAVGCCVLGLMSRAY